MTAAETEMLSNGEEERGEIRRNRENDQLLGSRKNMQTGRQELCGARARPAPAVTTALLRAVCSLWAERDSKCSAWWSSGLDSALVIQGPRVQFLGRELDPACHNED